MGTSCWISKCGAEVLSRIPVESIIGEKINCAIIRDLAYSSRKQLIEEQRKDSELGHIYRYLENPEDSSVNATISFNETTGKIPAGLFLGRKLITPFQKLVMVSDGTEFAVEDIERLFEEARRNTKAKHEKWENGLEVKINNEVIWKVGIRLTFNVEQVRIYRHRKCVNKELEVRIAKVYAMNGVLLTEYKGDQMSRCMVGRKAARRLHESNLLESSSSAFKVTGSIAYQHLSGYLATLDLNTLSNLNIPYLSFWSSLEINANLYSPERRLRRLVERFGTDSSQPPPKRKRDLFEGHKRPENKLRNRFLDLIYSPDDFNIYIYQSDTKTSSRERKKNYDLKLHFKGRNIYRIRFPYTMPIRL
ncbi:uncharacterized protein TNCV_4086381 [Trichonephila clavipes]|nr:uncharacterized protein TNCV_4086381 [Trichonephila clavipes]